MKTRKYKTLEGMIRQTEYGSINFTNFKRGQFWHKNRYCVNFELPESEMTKAYIMFAKAVYSRGAADKMYLLSRIRIKDTIRFGLFSRLRLSEKRASYNAGQDYDYEIRYMQKYLRS